MKWLFLFIGLLAGGMIGMTVMCLLALSSVAARHEEQKMK